MKKGENDHFVTDPLLLITKESDRPCHQPQGCWLATALKYSQRLPHTLSLSRHSWGIFFISFLTFLFFVVSLLITVMEHHPPFFRHHLPAQQQQQLWSIPHRARENLNNHQWHAGINQVGLICFSAFSFLLLLSPFAAFHFILKYKIQKIFSPLVSLLFCYCASTQLCGSAGPREENATG